MQVGSSFPLTVRINGQNSAAAQQFRTDSAADKPQRPAAQSQLPQRTETVTQAAAQAYMDAAEQSSRAREQAGFYSMDRTLSLRGQEALNYYLSNSGPSRYATDSAQLVGVDVYV